MRAPWRASRKTPAGFLPAGEMPRGGIRLLGLTVGTPAQRADGQPSLFDGIEA